MAIVEWSLLCIHCGPWYNRNVDYNRNETPSHIEKNATNFNDWLRNAYHGPRSRQVEGNSKLIDELPVWNKSIWDLKVPSYDSHGNKSSGIWKRECELGSKSHLFAELAGLASTFDILSGDRRWLKISKSYDPFHSKLIGHPNFLVRFRPHPSFQF